MKKIIKDNYTGLDSFVTSLSVGGFDRGGTYLHNGRNKVKLFEVEGRRLVVKQFRRPHLFNRFVYTFIRGTKAQRAYRNADILLLRGISTPVAIATIDTKIKGLVSESYLVTEYTDFKPVRDLVLEEKYLQAMGFNKLVEYTAFLHKKGIKHKDFTNTNVLYRLNEDLTFEFQLIDINRMSFGRITKIGCIASLKKVAEDSESIFHFTEKYARLRGWNRYFCQAVISSHRGMLEQRKKAKAALKRTIGRGN